MRRTTATRCACGVLAAALLVAGSVSAQPPDNEDLETRIAALLATHNLALPISFVPDPVFGIPASAVTFGTNLGLKDTQAVFVSPGDWGEWPNSDDACSFDFELPRAAAVHNDLLGFIKLEDVPADWGELTRNGQVLVDHANTGVNVRVLNEYLTGDPAASQSVSLPSGTHRFHWRAETQISDAFDIIIPAGLLAYNSIKYASAVANQGATAARQAAMQDAARETLRNIALNTGLVTASQLFETRTSVVHEREQIVTIYKQEPPQISTAEPVLTLEATDFGGVLYARVAEALRDTVQVSDPCGRPFTLGNDAPPLFGVGSTTLTWTVSDNGPLPGGGGYSENLFQQVVVEDTQAPIMVPPPSRVIEVPAVEPGLDAASVNLGAPRVVDLADPDPETGNDGPDFYPIDSRSPIIWTATDSAGNSSTAEQLITVKAAGSNTAPTVDDVSTDTLTSEPVDIVLNGQDADFLDGRFDPLSFRITERPVNGEFVAPLYPFFIEDYRTSPGGPYGEAFYLSGNRAAWLFDNVCQVLPGPNADKIEVDWVYEPEFVHVDDDGKVYMVDQYWQCSSSGASATPRISTWNRDGHFIGQIVYEGFNDAFVLDRDGFLYETKTIGSGSSREIVVNRCATDFVGKANRPDYCDSLGSVDANSAPGLQAGSVAYARVDSAQGLLYITDKRRVFVFDIRNDPPDPVYLDTLNPDSPFPLPNPSCAGSSSLGYAMDIDSTGALYMVNCANDRIEKFDASGFDAQGGFVPGDYVGWMGRCATSSNNACDEDQQISKGFACTDATCTRVELAGAEPGQFDTPLYVSIDPNDVLYIAEWDGYRVQRFAADGSFAGQALSTGTGVNQGEQPGFVLGNMGRPRAVSVNSTQFYVVDREEGFVHVFETSPLKDITDDSVTVTYVSNFDFHGASDSFRFVASDGLADSNVGTALIDVARNFRPPEALPLAVDTLEDVAVDIVLAAVDPDGIQGVDFNGLDVLDYQIVEAPEHGQLTFIVADNATATWRYLPDPESSGQDAFTFIANDGFADSRPAAVAIDIAFVDDPPIVVENELPPRIGLGFPFVLTGRFTDDGASDYFTSVVWNGETTIVEGGVDEDPDNPRIEGVLLVEPALGRGMGYGIAEHTFTTPGPKQVRFCILDEQSRGECLDSTVTPEPLVSLGLELPADHGETPPEAIPAGQDFSVDVVVRNQLPEGVSGLTADSIDMTATVEGAPVVFTGASVSGCQITAGGAQIDCALGNFEAGEERVVTLFFSSDGTTLEDADARIRVRFTTASASINDQTEAFITRTILNVNRIFSDRYEPRP
jgi:hypothetical protein